MQMIVPAVNRSPERVILGAKGKENCKSRAMLYAGSTAEANGAAMLGDNALANPKSQTRALLPLSRVEGAE